MTAYKILLDVPAADPALHFGDYAGAFAEIIEESDARFAIGLFGGWGSGKTTLMQAIESRLTPERCVPVWFSAWRYEKEAHLIVPLLDVLREGLLEWSEGRKGMAERAKETASTIGRVIHSLASGLSFKLSVPQVAEVSLDGGKALTRAREFDQEAEEANRPQSLYHGSFRALSDAFRDFVHDPGGPGGDGAPKRRIVVFVDDLDRCLPESALEVLESMKLFFDLEGFVFVVGLDRQVVEAAIDARYAGKMGEGSFRVKGSEYIKKIFQVPFTLPPVAPTQLGAFVDAVCAQGGLPADQVAELNTTVRPHLEFLALDGGINPREVKRYVNAFSLARKLKPTLDPAVVLALQTIDFRPDWAAVRESLYAYRDVFVDALERQVSGVQPGALLELNPALADVPLDFLRYVGDEGPANALLKAGAAVDEYIYAGAATRSEGFWGMADLVRDTARIREALRPAALEKADAPPVQELLSRVSALRSRFESERTFAPVIANLDAQLRQAVEELPLADGAERERWVARNGARISQAVNEVLRLSRLR